MDLDELIEIHHRDVEVPARVTRRAYEQVWKDRGWRINLRSDTPPVKNKETSKKEDS